MIRKMIGHSKNHLAWINAKSNEDESIYTYIWDVSIYNNYRDVAVFKYRALSMGRILETKLFTTWDLSPSMYLFIDGY